MRQIEGLYFKVVGNASNPYRKVVKVHGETCTVAYPVGWPGKNWDGTISHVRIDDMIRCIDSGAYKVISKLEGMVKVGI